MKILVTVGTTSFDSLIEFLDSATFTHGYEFVFQVADGSYLPKNYNFFKTDNNLWDNYKDYFIITHCGAGSVYFLLENNFDFICIPNLERADKHQLDIANHIMKKRLASVAYDFQELNSILDTQIFKKEKFLPYEKEDFFKSDEINRLIRRCREKNDK